MLRVAAEVAGTMHTSLSVMTGSDDCRLLLLMTASAVLIETSQACLPAPCFWPLPLPFPFLRYRAWADALACCGGSTARTRKAPLGKLMLLAVCVALGCMNGLVLIV